LTDISKQKWNLYTRDSRPFDRSWEDWTALWWKWSFGNGTVPEMTPIGDITGVLCCKNQNEPYVWFLAGTFGGKAIRKCTIPKGKSLFFPIVNDLISYAAYYHLKTEGQLRAYARDDLDTTTIISLIVDGEQLEDIRNYRVQSNLFDITIPVETPQGVVQTHTEGITDGYWAFIKPPLSGSHTINLYGEKSLYDSVQHCSYKGEDGRFKTEVVYEISVE
jgi:hypothetical protein